MEPPILSDLETIFSNVVNVLIAAGALTLFILLLTSGFKYLTAGGDPKTLESAKKTLTYALGGFIALIFSFLILKIVGLVTSNDNLLNDFVIYRQ